MTILTFNGVEFQSVKQQNQIYLTSAELAKALGYSQENAVAKIYNRNADEFSSDMTLIIKNPQLPNLGMRVFSLRGCHLVAMFARTKVAKEFRKWVLDILDKEVGEPTIITDTLSTKEERKPLVKAVNMLVDKSNLNYDEAWHLVHQYFNIKSVNELKSYQIKAAIAYIHGLIVANAQKTNQKQKVDDEFLFDTLAHAAEYLKEYANTIYVLSNLRFTSDKLATNITKFVGECFTDMVKLSQDMDLRNQAGRPMFEERRINFYHGAALTW